jgi:hypothetical protein
MRNFLRRGPRGRDHYLNEAVLVFQGVITDRADGGQQNDYLNKTLYVTNEAEIRQKNDHLNSGTTAS